MHVLVTGGLGFIGSNLIRRLLHERDWRITNLDAVTYAANPANLADVEGHPRYRFVEGDVADRDAVDALFRDSAFDAVIHCAAESHVDRSIHDTGVFLRTNVEGTLVLLEAVREHRVARHVQLSTDEVYGSLAPDHPPFTEGSTLAPRSPYSASKAAADHLVHAFHVTYGLDTVITRCSNNYGPYQHPEKLIPLAITAALRGLAVPLFGDGRHRRDWIHVDDHARGLLAALEHGRAGAVYNFGGGAERANRDVVHEIVRRVGADPALITPVVDRPGHDRRYAMDFSRARTELDWAPARDFETGLAETVAWYREHEAWWRESAELAYAASQAMIRRREAEAAS